MSKQKFVIEALKEFYTNLTVSKDDGYHIIFSIRDESGLKGDGVFYKDAREWHFTYDNFPFPKKFYQWNLPVKTFDDLELYFEQINVKLYRN